MTSEIQINHATYKEPLFTNRFIKYDTLKLKVAEIQTRGIFKVQHVGSSVRQREIYQLTIGNGKTQVMLWSQMHGDEPTGTLAFFDLFNFFAADDQHNGLRKQILDNCTLHFIPMVNPDGAAVHQRRNAQGIDINRDFLKRQTPEANLLIALQQRIKPEFGFNMHDQDTLWSVTGSKKPAAISLLAPPPDEAASQTSGRIKAMLVIAGMYEKLKTIIPGSIGRWSEEYEPRAFGDNFQQLGTSTILMEAGGYDQDFEKQYVRKITFEILLHALMQIATRQYTSRQISNYYTIPTNNKELFHLLIRNCKIRIENMVITADIGLNYSETIDLKQGNHQKIYTVTDFGDLSIWNAYEIFEANNAIINAPINIGAKLNLKVTGKNGKMLHFDDGVIKSS